MLYSSTVIKYPVLTILSTGKRSFENMGLLIQRSGDTVKRLLHPAEHSFQLSRSISQSMFAKNEILCVGIDDTLLRKIYSKFMQGAGMFFDTKIGRSIMAYRLVICIITDGKFAIPINCAYLFAKEILDSIDEKFPTKDAIAKSFVKTAIKLFPGKKIVVVVDGLYASGEFVRWCRVGNIKLEARMHSNRVVEYKGERIKVKDLLKKMDCGQKAAKWRVQSQLCGMRSTWSLQLFVDLIKRAGNQLFFKQQRTKPCLVNTWPIIKKDGKLSCLTELQNKKLDCKNVFPDRLKLNTTT